MTIFNVFTLFGGLAFFLFGMHTMSSGLEKMAGGRLERTLRKITSNQGKSIALGAGITIAIQSSSAMTVMLVGLVNSGIMQLQQSVGVIMGSNIGTTLTPWLFALTGIESDNFFVKLLQPEVFSALVALVGIILILFTKTGRRKDLGNIMLGFAILMFGMSTMSGAVSPLRESEAFTGILTAFSNPFLGVLVGAVFTGIIQSSAASVGILQALSSTGALTFGAAIPIIMGQNIGTCVTSLISSIGANKNAKRVAMVHVYFNVIGTVLCLAVFYLLNSIFRFSFIDGPITAMNIALVHTVFNISTTLVLLPFSKLLEKLAILTVRERNKKEEYSFLDERLLLTPSFAIAQCRNMTVKMGQLATEGLHKAIGLFDAYDAKIGDEIERNEEEIDQFEDKLGTFLVKLSSRELTVPDSEETSKLLHVIGDIERIGDHAVNLLRAAREMHEKEMVFSPDAQKELGVMTTAIGEIVTLTFKAFENNDVAVAAEVEPLEQVIDLLKSNLKIRHINRLRDGQCTIELGFVFSDILSNYERISDHCSNIAVCVIRMKVEDLDTHTYLNEVKTSGNPAFETQFEAYKEKYTLPL